ncbi:alpha-D-ribose 1-methylphosphonate 5-triphosphate diphosphatase [Albimonas sp. CAU 1670]|uniref:alpha-D-ribose 1-methylphosphonate 5-triphosphate diphosphatase n=1 Tax=Albimonas sp. CAU 1670 TaxID=3032599 RepID=UPI0023DC25D0|nr:alpha-D-ribose 1-methylphosphonate 5-triphosphate diphosphatase [Albimonas sp. CAU 1670]MDF2232050.1 alpha-D-ribose 1-methylphosphonate 5-triphosphate diphosphatase [Albimonas sp. CAU 1670]
MTLADAPAQAAPDPSAAARPGAAETVLTNARLVLADEVVAGSVLIRDGRIAAIEPGPARAGEDMGGDLLVPGLIELHTDNLERHCQPRPGVHWPREAAVIAHDAELASTGIATVFDAIRVGSVASFDKAAFGAYAREATDAIKTLKGRGALKITHLLHLRAEICSETLAQELAEFGPEDGVRIVSLMDHTPGFRQFRDIDQLKKYHMGKHGRTQAEFDEYMQFLGELSLRVSSSHEAEAVAAARAWGATLASHDDTDVAHVEASAAHGARIAEFPTTLEAARACRAHGIAVMMGAPNLLRGGSHSGNVAAADLAAEGLLDILSSDYVPSSLLMAAAKLGEMTGDMAKGFATVTRAPARATGLDDRGEIAPGLRADLVRVCVDHAAPVVRGMWVEGRRV